MTIAVIGAGNMGGALVQGWLRQRALDPADIILTNPHPWKLEPFSQQGVRTSTDNNSACEADILILAVKPWLVEHVLDELPLRSGTVVVCLAAGISGIQLSEMLPAGQRCYLAIPNTAVAVGEGVTFLTPVWEDPAMTAALERLFGSVGLVLQIEERMLPAGTALASCGTAYALRYIRAASEGGVEMGIPPAEAARIVSQTVKGAATLLLDGGGHPEAEIDKVTTPGGLTIQGLNAMEEAGFTRAVIAGLKAGQ